MSGSKDISKKWVYHIHYTAPVSGKRKVVCIAAWHYDEALTEARRMLPRHTRIDGCRRIELKGNSDEQASG